MRAYVLADLLRKTFELHGYQVKQVINITDVGHLTDSDTSDLGDDKVEKAAKAENKSAKEITKKYYDVFRDDLSKLNIKTDSTIFPWATEHIKEQIDMISTLEKKGYTYKTSDGIYFDTSKYEAYGMLGNIDIKGLKEGARVTVNEEKKNPTDFALWKFSKKGEQRLQEWESPWGKGFPGWHIECSAMSIKYLGQTFDIHTGGIDHIPVHHNNEIAQSVCATGEPYVRFWLHNAFINITDEKISKSLGNTITLSQIIEKGFSPLALRYWFLGARYSTQMNFTWEALEDSQRSLEKLNRWYSTLEKPSQKIATTSNTYEQSFISKISDDLDTPQALATLWQLTKDTELSDEIKYSTANKINSVLGILSENTQSADVFSDEVFDLIEKRNEARKNKDFKASDELRDALLKHNIQSEDSNDGSRYFHA